MRILFLSSDPGLSSRQVGGGGTHVRGTLEALEAAGAEVAALIAGDGGGDGSALPWAANRVRRFVPRSLRLLRSDLRRRAGGRRTLEELERRVADARPAVVYERNAYLLDVGSRLRRRLPIVHVLESDLEAAEFWRAAWGTFSHRYARWLEDRKHRSADAIVVMSEAAAELAATRYGVPRERVFVKGLGVDERFLAVPRSAPDRPTVVFSGTFQPYHGVDLLLEAAGELQRRDRELVVKLVGGGPRRGEYEREARERGLGNVEFAGPFPHDEMPAVIAASTLAVIPDSAPFMYPVKLLEYGAVGLPVVCPDYAAYREFDRDGRRLFTFLPRSPIALADALEHVLESPEEAAARAGALRALVAERYTWDAVGVRLVGFLEALTR